MRHLLLALVVALIAWALANAVARLLLGYAQLAAQQTSRMAVTGWSGPRG